MGRKIKEVDFDFDEIKDVIKNSSEETAIYVGCDSVRKRKLVAYVTVIVVHKDGNAGGRIFKDIKIMPNYEREPKKLRMRMMNEVGYAVAAATEIVEEVGNRPFEIHLDINPNPRYASSVVCKEAIGYVLGSFGFEPKLKPEAFVASFAADKFAKHVTKKVRK